LQQGPVFPDTFLRRFFQGRMEPAGREVCPCGREAFAVREQTPPQGALYSLENDR
jgi:hypothetical protein